MESKEEIVKNWLPRYTVATLEQFGSYILLTNFDGYLQKFAEWHNVEIIGRGKAMPMATADGITMINFSMGSANAVKTNQQLPPPRLQSRPKLRYLSRSAFYKWLWSP
jgi:hypothetical protein